MAKKGKGKKNGKDKRKAKVEAPPVEVAEPEPEVVHSEFTGEGWAKGDEDKVQEPEAIVEPQEVVVPPPQVAEPEPEEKPKAPAVAQVALAAPATPVPPPAEAQLVVTGTLQSQPAAVVVSKQLGGGMMRSAVIIWRQPNGRIEEMGRRRLKHINADGCVAWAKQMLTGVKGFRWQEQVTLEEIAKEL